MQKCCKKKNVHIKVDRSFPYSHNKSVTHAEMYVGFSSFIWMSIRTRRTTFELKTRSYPIDYINNKNGTGKRKKEREKLFPFAEKQRQRVSE